MEIKLTELSGNIPHSDLDFWSDDVISEPYPFYKGLRDLGPAVWLDRHSAWVIPRHESLRLALVNGQVFSSARGCMMNEPTNRAFQGAMLCTDDPEHRKLRRVFSRPLSPAALAQLEGRLEELARVRVDQLVERRSFDAVSELAHLLPISVVTDLVGLTEEGKAHMLRWAAAIFNAFGPDTHARTLEGMQIMQEAFTYIEQLDPKDLAEGGWGSALFQAANRGEISVQTAKAMLMDYIGPALDTTINAISSAIALFAAYPGQWDLLRQDISLTSAVIDEVLRLESPIRAFSRFVTRDFELCGVPLGAGSRALMLYASANRDERRYANPEMFDIRRNARDHFGFGYGTHICGGMNVAKLEFRVIIRALAKRIKRFHILEEHRDLHNTLRGIARLNVSVEVA